MPEVLLANIKGEARRQAMHEAIARGTLDRLPAALRAERLPASVWAFVRGLHPRQWAGETLPDCLPNEVEIARVVYPDTTLCDVTSFRARRVSGRITFRAVTDNADELDTVPSSAALPLTLSELVQLIEGTGHGVAYWDAQIDCGIAPEDLSAITVSSIFYQDLLSYYADRAAEWLHHHRPGRPRR